ncbi:MAG: hypothetical protein AAF387_21240 [Pseudomonadota bacterium]
MPSSITTRLLELGPLRICLLGAAIFVTVLAPLADGSVHIRDWRLLPSVIAPAVMMMLMFAIPLDITMTRVFMADAPNEQARLRLKRAIWCDPLVLALMALAWTPFILKVIDFWPFA